MTETTAREVTVSHWIVSLKKLAYLITFIPHIILPVTYFIWQETGYANAWAYFPVVFIFGIVTVVDHLVGKDPVNPDEKEAVPAMSNEWYYPFITLMHVPVMFATLYFGGNVFVSGELSLVGQIGWVVSIGVVSGILAINIGHELIHKDTKLEQWAGGLLLSMVCYSGFKVEHIRGHHVNVSTPEDASSSRYGQTVYQFLPHAYLHNFLNAWKLEAKRLKRKGHSAFNWRNELIWWYGLSAAFILTALVFWGWMGVVFFLVQSFIAFTELEVINYIEHYGLHRRKLKNGRYERTTIHHSWNSNFMITNIILFQLQRHSDHHAYPKRRYQVLRHHDESPQMPSGYAGMLVLALVPPLWFKVMNPKVEAYYKGEEHQLS